MHCRLSAILLVSLFLFSLILLANATTETRYFRKVGTAFQLLTTQGTTTQFLLGLHPDINWGVRVWKGDTELTAGAGNEVAIVVYVQPIDGLYGATWSCPGSSASGEVIVKLYNWGIDGVKHLIGTFQTDNLSEKVLDASTWTVYYHLIGAYDPEYFSLMYIMFYYNRALYNSRIANLQWSEAPPVGEWHSLSFDFSLLTRKSFSLAFNFNLRTGQQNKLQYQFNLQTRDMHSIAYLFDLGTPIWNRLLYYFNILARLSPQILATAVAACFILLLVLILVFIGVRRRK